jgi:hypothetical protein
LKWNWLAYLIMCILLLFLFCWTNIFRDFGKLLVQQKRNKRRIHTIKSSSLFHFKIYILWHIFTIIYITILTLARLGRLCFEKLRFFLNVLSECRKYYFRDLNFKNFLGACPQIPLANSCLRYSAHTFGDRILSWGEGKENGPFGSFAPPLKNP